MNRKLLASVLLALFLAQASLAKHISVIREAVTSVDIVKKIGESINLNLNEPYVHWYKKPDVDFGESFFEDDFHKIGKEPNQAFKSLTIKKANFTDAGLGVYRAIEIESKNETDFNIFLYDMENHKTTLVYEDAVTDLETETLQGGKKIKLEIELKSFDQQSQLDFKYRKEAMPLDALIVNEKKVKSIICNHEEDGLLVKCLEVNLGEHVPFEKCENQASFVFGYEYENADKFDGVDIKKTSFEAEIQVKYPPKFDVKEYVILYEDPSIPFNLDCETKCANPTEGLTYEWMLGDKVIHKSSPYFNLTFASLQLETHSAEIVCTVRNGIDAGDYLKESQRIFKIHNPSDPDTTTEAPSTTTAQPDTTPSAVTVQPSNATSEFGFFGNVYNKVKFFVQFVI